MTDAPTLSHAEAPAHAPIALPTRAQRLRRRYHALLFVGAATLVGTFFVAVLFGAYGPFHARVNATDRLTAWDVWLALFNQGDAWKRSAVLHIRLPRILLAALTGAALACAGATMQGVFRNPLAEPYILGVSSGAALGAAVHIVLGVGVGAGLLMLPLLAFLGGVGAMFVTYAIAGTAGGPRTETLLLAGVAMHSLLTAILLGFLFFADEQFRSLFFWILGGFNRATWSSVAVLAAVALVATLHFAHRAERLNLLLLGDDQAQSLGVDVAREKRALLLTASLLASVSVAVAGAIGFVGLIVPHLLRLVLGADYRFLLPASVLFGGAFLVWADLGARTVLPMGELPIGVLTALAGAPFFLYLLHRRRRSPALRF